MSQYHKEYPFTREGLNRMLLDVKLDKIGRKMDIAFWCAIGCLTAVGFIATQTATTMVACTVTSKTVKFLMRH